MQKGIFSGFMSLLVIPTLSAAVTCAPYNNVSYAIKANGASGTLTKNQSCVNGAYFINSQINVTKGFFSKQINQAASGTYASPNIISAQNFTASNNSTAFPAGNMDPLSLVLLLSSSLSASATTFSAIPLFDNGNTINVQCAVSNANANVTIGSGTTVAATQVTCSTSDNSTVLSYSFSQDGAAMLLAATSTENGTQTLSTAINSYTSN